MRHVISICGECKGKGTALAKALSGIVAEGIDVQISACLNVCSQPLTVAARATGKEAYLFAGVTPEDADAVATFARMWQAAPDGAIADARPLGRLRSCLIGRIPA